MPNNVQIGGIIYAVIGLLGIFHYSKIPPDSQDREIKIKKLTSVVITIGGLLIILVGALFDINTFGNPLLTLVTVIALYYVIPILKDVFPKRR